MTLQERAGNFRIKQDGALLHSKRPASSERCTLDLPGFKNLEDLHIGMFLV